MVCAPVRSIIPSLKLGDYLSVQAHKPCSISHLLSAVVGFDLLSCRKTPPVFLKNVYGRRGVVDEWLETLYYGTERS